MRSSSSSGACFSPTQKSEQGSDLLLHQRKQNKPKKSKEQDAPSKAHNTRSDKNIVQRKTDR